MKMRILHLFFMTFVLLCLKPPPALSFHTIQSSSPGNSIPLNFSPDDLMLVPPSEKFLACHFHPQCYCRYPQTTEVYEAILTLWHHSSFNETSFLKSLQKEFGYNKNHLERNKWESVGGGDGGQVGGMLDIGDFVEVLVNGTENGRVIGTSGNGRLYDPGPVYEFFCVGVKMASLPTDYTTPTGGLPLSHVSIVGSHLHLLDGSAFAGLEVQNIQLNKNGIFSISEFAFSSLSNSLVGLDIGENNLDEVPFAAFKTLKLLEWLNLSNNKIHSLLSPGEWFGVSTSLRQLTISSNSIEILPPKLFPAFSRLIWLDLSSNFIRNLSQHNLPPNLQTLILMKNPISVFPLSIFGLRSLSWIILSGCALEHVPREWPRGIPPAQIKQMDLRGNFIQHWPRHPFSSSLKAMDIDVSNNYIEALPSGSFSSMNAFRLSLGHNRIQTIDPGAFHTLEPSLQYLSLENNRLSSVPWEALKNLTSLKMLYLGGNYGIGDKEWDNWPPDFECHLLYLGVNGNGLTRLPKKVISNCRSLHHLNLGYNQIMNLDDFVTLKFRDLSTLILRNNPIHALSFEDNKVYALPSQEIPQSSSTILNPNEMHVLSPPSQRIPNIFRPESFPNLFELSLSFCELSGELSFPPLPLTNLEISNGLKSATSIGPESFQALSRLEWIALDHNQINSVSDYTFYSNKNISYVNLEFNRISALPKQMFHPDIHFRIGDVRLGHNKIPTISTDSFLSFPAINLDLSYNSIQAIERHAFNVAPPSPQSPTSGRKEELKGGDGLNLYLRNNKISVIKNAAFAQEKFSLVDLSFNALTHFHFDAFGKRTIVGGVNISNNMLEKVSSHSNGKKMLIKFLDLRNNRLSYVGLRIEGVCPVELLDLSMNRIERVDSSLFPRNCTKIKEINFNANQITTLDPDSFSQLRDLSVLKLRGNVISFVPEILFIRNHKLTYLDFSENKIRSLPRDSLVGSNIEILDLSGNEFVNLPVGALSQISRRLKVLDMSHNSMEHLDSTMFETLPGLVHLNLSSNRLSILPDNAFANLGSLRELDLSRNYLRANFKELFHFLPKLKILRLADTGIKALPHLPLPHLISLDLSRNGLSEISMQSITQLNRLRELDLSENQLTNSRIPNWAPLGNLVTLRLNSNPLKSLTRDTFFGLNRLENLELLGLERVDRFDSDVLSSLMNLKRLAVETYPNIEKYRFRLGAVLSGTDGLEDLLVSIKETTLSDQILGGILPGLRKLTVTGPNLRRIEEDAFTGLQNCQHMELTITQTSVEEIPSRIFELLLNAEMVKVDISENRISTLSSTSLYPNSSLWYGKGTKLVKGGLILDGNEWICDCNLVWIGDWLRRWMRESFESHSVTVPEVHAIYEMVSRPTCIDSRYGTHIPLVQLYPDHICHASALSQAVSHYGHYYYGHLQLLVLILIATLIASS